MYDDKENFAQQTQGVSTLQTLGPALARVGFSTALSLLSANSDTEIPAAGNVASAILTIREEPVRDVRIRMLLSTLAQRPYDEAIADSLRLEFLRARRFLENALIGQDIATRGVYRRDTPLPTLETLRAIDAWVFPTTVSALLPQPVGGFPPLLQEQIRLTFVALSEREFAALSDELAPRLADDPSAAGDLALALLYRGEADDAQRAWPLARRALAGQTLDPAVYFTLFSAYESDADKREDLQTAYRQAEQRFVDTALVASAAGLPLLAAFYCCCALHLDPAQVTALTLLADLCLDLEDLDALRALVRHAEQQEGQQLRAAGDLLRTRLAIALNGEAPTPPRSPAGFLSLARAESLLAAGECAAALAVMAQLPSPVADSCHALRLHHFCQLLTHRDSAPERAFEVFDRVGMRLLGDAPFWRTTAQLTADRGSLRAQFTRTLQQALALVPHVRLFWELLAESLDDTGFASAIREDLGARAISTTPSSGGAHHA